MITATDVELRAGSRILIEKASFRVGPGDRIGLVGRNGAGKTTLTKTLAGETIPASGTISRSGQVGYLPQDPRTGDLDIIARDRILSARGLDDIMRRMRENEKRMASDDQATHDKAMRRYARLEDEFIAADGYAAESEAATIASALGLPDRVLSQPLHTLSGGQRRRVELSRILFGDNEVLLLDEPTNHLDADSIVWLRDFLKTYKGGFIVISHDVNLVESLREQGLPPGRQPRRDRLLQHGLEALPRAARGRTSGAASASGPTSEKKAAVLNSQADKMRAKATKTVAAQNMARRAERMLAGLEAVRQSDKVAKLRFPTPAPCGKTPLLATGLSKSYGSLEIFTDVDLAVDRGSKRRHPGPERRRQDHAAAAARRRRGRRTPARSRRATASSSATTRRSTRRSTRSARCWRTCAAPRRTWTWSTCARRWARSCSPATTWTSRPACSPAGRRRGSRWPRWWSPRRTCCCSTSRPTTWTRPRARRSSGRSRTYEGAVIMVTHDEGAVQALDPERVILLPDGDEDLWSEQYLDLVSLA